jgi:hypothetical protein
MAVGLRDFLRPVALILVLCLAAGCASTDEQEFTVDPPLHQLSDLPEDEQSFPIEVHDPWEGFNRGVYRFNAAFDEFPSSTPTKPSLPNSPERAYRISSPTSARSRPSPTRFCSSGSRKRA